MFKIGIPYRFIDADILNYLRSHGFRLEERLAGKFFIKCSKPRCVIHLLNSYMLPELVEEGVLDLVILPSVDFRETQTFCVPLLDLNVPVGRLMLGVKKAVAGLPLDEMPIKTVLTRTPLLTKEFLEKNGLKWKIRVVRGVTESLSSVFGKSTAIVDYVRTGRTMDLNGMVPVTEIASSSVIALSHPNKVHSPEIKRIRKMLAAPASHGQQQSGVVIYSKPLPGRE